MKIERKVTRKIRVGSVDIGGGAPISVQSMTNTRTSEIRETVNQIKYLEDLGCEIIRVAVPDEASARAISEIKKQITIPLIADIHFDYRLAISSIKHGADKIRINPGNIGSEERVEKVIKEAKSADIPIRIGVNSGSIEKELLQKYGHPTPQAMVDSAMKYINFFKDRDMEKVIVSIKSSNVPDTIQAYRLFSSKSDYPLHIGVTEAGTRFTGAVRTAVGLGILLNEGIGDTIRVSLAGDPGWEIRSGFEILKSLNLREHGVSLIVCPTCGRTEIPVAELAQEIEELTSHIGFPIKIAVMGCVVNGPGEAREADIGIAGGKDKAVIFRKGQVFKTVPNSDLVNVFLKEINSFIKEEFKK